jgi:hypothetical protein
MGSQPSQKPRSVAELLRSCIEAGDGLRSRIGGVLGSRAVAEQALIFLAPKKTLETARFEFLRDFDMVWSLFLSFRQPARLYYSDKWPRESCTAFRLSFLKKTALRLCPRELAHLCHISTFCETTSGYHRWPARLRRPATFHPD